MFQPACHLFWKLKKKEERWIVEPVTSRYKSMKLHRGLLKVLNEHAHRVKPLSSCSAWTTSQQVRRSQAVGFSCLTGRLNPNKIGAVSLREPLDTLCRVFRERSPPLVFMEGTGAGLGRINARAASRQELFSRLAYSHIGGIITQGSRVLRG